MKFLCDQCKAKYQIADEKVAGKTVRMKCRKCGHMIEVRAAVTETSVSIDMPREDVPAPLPGAAPPPRPANKPAPPKTGAGLATSLAQAGRPTAPRPSASNRPEHGGGLSNAFTRSVQKEDDALEMLELHAADEWYVAINGVPVGPVRVTELRRKAASGAVTEDSLVWQEGLEEWRPVKAINELAAVVRDAIAGGRVSLATPPPAEARRSSVPPPPAPRPAIPARPPTAGPFAPPRPAAHPFAPAAPAPASPATSARSNVVPFAARGTAGLATAERIEEHNAASAPFAPAPMQGVIAPDPFASPAPAPTPAAPPTTAPATPSIAPAAPRKAPPWIAIAMIVLAGAFGVTAAIILLTRPPQQTPQPVVINLPSAQPALPIADVPPPDIAAATPADVPSAKPQPLRNPATQPKPTTTSNSPSSTNPAIAALIGTTNGPNPTGPTGGSGSSGGGQLTSDQVEATVRAHQAGVKRSCFERIATDKTGTVQVTVSAVVAPSGGVQSATATGNDPMIAKCIETAVKSWQFPSSGSTTPVNIPFKFVRQ